MKPMTARPAFAVFAATLLLAAPARAAGRAPVPPDGSGDGRSQPTSPGGATPA